MILADKTVLRNMICMVGIWVSASFGYYLISYQLKYLKGDLYLNGAMSSISEVVCYLISGFLQAKFGFRRVLVIAFCVSLVFMLVLTFVEIDSNAVLSLIILSCKGGVSMGFNLAYLGNAQFFPVSIVATSYGICSFVARVFTIFSPYIAEIKPQEIPQLFFVVFCGVAMVAGIFLKPPSK